MGRLGRQGVVGCRDQGLVNRREEVRPAQDLLPARVPRLSAPVCPHSKLELRATYRLGFDKAVVVLVSLEVACLALHRRSRNQPSSEVFGVRDVLEESDVDLGELCRHVRKRVGLHLWRAP